MANDLVRLGSLLGGTKNIVGNKYADLVLETLGKVYIKTGNSSRVLNDIFKLLDKFNNEEDPQSKTLIVESLEDIEYPGDGTLIFDVKKKALYIAYDLRYVLILDSLEFVDNAKGYVKRSGDTMTGTLTIKTTGAPLIVASKELVKNLNAEYLGGYSASRFAVKILNEKIYGLWSFQKETTFNGVTKFNNKAIHNDNLIMDNADIVTTGSIGSPEFASGFLGYGWRFDAATLMLTVDYLVVRKAMLVFELIVNQVKATNGALWVTDSCEVEEVFQIHYLNTLTDLNSITTDRWYLPYNGNVGNTFIEGGNVKAQYLTGENISGPGLNDVGSAKTFYNFNYLIKFNSIPSGLTQSSFEDLANFTGDCEIVHLFEENNVSKSTLCQDLLETNIMYNISTTPKFFSTNKQKEFDKSTIRQIYSYYKYFGIEAQPEINTSRISNKIKIVKMKEDTYPTFREGDLVRCLKFLNNNIKYYDALVGTNFNTYYYVMLVADSVFDKATTIKYSETGELKEMTETYNSHLYDKTSQRYKEDVLNYETSDDNFYESFEESTKEPIKIQDDPSVVLTSISPKDGLVRIGNLYKKDRQNSVFITSSELYSPYVQTMSGVDRPDYSVVYTMPKFKTRRKVVDGVITEMYYFLSDLEPSDTTVYDEEWVIDNTIESPTEELIYLITEDTNEVIFILYDGNYNDAIQLENIYKKLYYKYYKEPNLECDIEKNIVTGKYKSTYSNHVKARFGRLDGIYHELFGDKQPYGYGLYGDNVFLTGEFFLSNGLAVANIGEDIKLEINNNFGEAGLYIQSDNGKPYIILTADLIKILTANGKQTALFTNERIEASLLRVSDLEAAAYYKYFIDTPQVDAAGNPVLDENGNLVIITEEFSFKSKEGIISAMAGNGHIDSQVRKTESGGIATEIDKNYPYVIISSEEGKLTASSAELIGGVLTLYSADLLTEVVVSALGESHSGMTVSRKISIADESYTPVAYFNGEIIPDPYKLYKSDNVSIEYNEKVSINDLFGKIFPNDYYVVRYNKNMQHSYIPGYIDPYGVEYNDENWHPGIYEKIDYIPITTSDVVISKPTDILITGDIEFRLNMENKVHSEGNVYASIVYRKNGGTLDYFVGNRYNEYLNGYFDYYGLLKLSGITKKTNFSKSTTLQEGTYQFFLKVSLQLTLDNKWYEEHKDYYEYLDIPLYPTSIWNPWYSCGINISGFKALSNQFTTRYFGNGFTSGFNELNYFSIYHNQNASNPAMVMDFLSLGSGMSFNNGKAYYYAKLGTESAKLAMPIPIYSAIIRPQIWDKDYGMRYTWENCNYLLNPVTGYGGAPIVDGYRHWRANGGNAMNPYGWNKEAENNHGDFVIDFSNNDYYKGIDFSSNDVVIMCTGIAWKDKDNNNASYYMKGSVASTSSLAVRIYLTDDASTNDGACYIMIYYLPAKITNYSV